MAADHARAIEPTYRRLRKPINAERSAFFGSFQDTDEVWQAWMKTLEIAEAASSRVVLFQCPASLVKNASDFAGVFETASGRTLQVVADGFSLNIAVGDKNIPLEGLGEDRFLADEYSWQRFPLVFGRDARKTVVELSHGSDWYVNQNYTGPKVISTPPAYDAFVGHYRSGSPWFRSTRIVLRSGKLWADGTTPLEPLGQALFRLGSDSWGPDVAEFLQVANGTALLLKINGSDRWRVETP
jgi:hypothetical protein